MSDKFIDAYNRAVQYADSIEEAKYEFKIWKNHFVGRFGELIVEDCVEVIIDADESGKLVLAEPYRTIMYKVYDAFDM